MGPRYILGQQCPHISKNKEEIRKYHELRGAEAKTKDLASVGATYRNQINKRVLIPDILFNVYSEGRAQHGINEEFWVNVGVSVVGCIVLVSDILVDVCTARRGTRRWWCHGSWP